MGQGQVSMMPVPTLYTCGHSNREPARLLEMLRWQGIDRLIDIRRYPVSRRHPDFTREIFQRWLEAAGIRYQWEGGVLGGRRKARPDSPHSALADDLRGFADHMESPGFTCLAGNLVRMAASERVALMCSERLPEHCHRNLVADYLLARGCRIVHLIDEGEMREHRLHPRALRVGDAVVYNRETTLPLDLG